MEETIRKISSYKKESNKTQAKELSDHFATLLRGNFDKSELVDKLVEFSPLVTKTFITTKYAEIAKKENLSPLLHGFLTTKKIQTAHLSNRIFPIIAIFVQENNQTPEFGQFFCSFISRIEHTGVVEKKENSASVQFFSNDNAREITFSKNNFELFRKNILNQEGDLNYRFLQLDYSAVKVGMLRSVNRFIIGLGELEMLDLSHEIAVMWADKYEMEFPKQRETAPEPTMQKDSVANESAEEKKPQSRKNGGNSSETPSSEKVKKDKSKPLSLPNNATIVASSGNKQAKKESENTKNPTTNSPELPEESGIIPSLDSSVMVSELQTAEKSLLATINRAENAMGKMSDSLSDSLGMLDVQREEISKLKREQGTLESELTSTSKQLADATTEVESLKKKIAFLEGAVLEEKEEKQSLVQSHEHKTQEIEEQASKIIDLEQRLKKSLEQDAIAENQELITLKKELSRKLQEAYKDYADMNGQDYSSDLLESHKFLLDRIFKMFKRHGINIEEG